MNQPIAPDPLSSTLRHRLWRMQSRYAPYLFLLPFALLFCIFLAYPLGRSISLSFYKAAGPRAMRWVGLGNYRFLLTDKLFWLSVANTLGFTIIFVSLQVPLSLGLAILLDHPRLRGRSLLRVAFFSSYLVGTVFAALLFVLLLAPRYGLINRLIGAVFPFIGTEINWRTDPWLAMPALILAALWLSVGYGMIYFQAALQSVERELYEAADVDGAGPWGRFWNVTLPGIKPVLLFLMLVATVGSLQLFELPYILFGGTGPRLRGLTVVYYLYIQGYYAGDLGFASAVGWALVVLIGFVAAIQMKVSGATREL